jgi:hypothetical protein
MIAMCSERHKQVRKRSRAYADELFATCSAHRHFGHTKLFVRWVLTGYTRLL